MALELHHTGAKFQTTHWTLLAALHKGDEADHRRVFDELVRNYWPPVYAFLQAARHPPDRAAELTQAFFVEVVFQRGLFERADHRSGRLRTLLLTALNRFLIDQHRRLQARPEGHAVQLGDHRAEDQRHPVDPSATPDAAFHQRWMVGLLEEALRRAEHHYRSTGKPGHWMLFEARILHPAAHGMTAPALAAAAEEMGFSSAADAAAAVQTVKKRVLNLLRDIARETSEDEAQAIDEYESLVSGLA
ncbi:MAG: hypothetical protein IT436_13490 [Phycisphaerales bacterium]|nr:hypothetical protein [Phycisphaerales bacterium]